MGGTPREVPQGFLGSKTAELASNRHQVRTRRLLHQGSSSIGYVCGRIATIVESQAFGVLQPSPVASFGSEGTRVEKGALGVRKKKMKKETAYSII